MPRIKEILLASLVLATPALFSQNVQALEYKTLLGQLTLVMQTGIAVL